MVLDKPHGLLTVPGKHPHLADCLERRAAAQFSGALIVHRLDKDTSGLIVLGLTPEAHAHVGLQFEKRLVSKTYIARIWGEMKNPSGTVDEPIITDWPNRPKQKIDHENGREAITDYEIISVKDKVTRVLLSPKTGRSHQLRVHMLHLGHPILGDNLYAHDNALDGAPRLQLHATSLSISHPTTGERMAFNSTCPF